LLFFLLSKACFQKVNPIFYESKLGIYFYKLIVNVSLMRIEPTSKSSDPFI
jgi:hypothetical protein